MRRLFDQVQLWRASILSSLFLLLPPQANATTISRIAVTWHDTVETSLRLDFESTINAMSGESLTETRLNRLFESLLSDLAGAGYHHAVCAPRDFETIGDAILFAIDVKPGLQSTITKWGLLGLVRTDSAWLANALSLPVGAIASASNLKSAMSRLASFPNIQLAGPPEIVTNNSDSEVIVHLHLREATPARFEGAIAAGSTDGDDQSLLGDFSLGLDGLFRRAHSFDIRYAHPQPQERLLRLDYSEHHAVWRPLSSRAQFEDWRRDDHRQRISTGLSITPISSASFSLQAGGNWLKVSPLSNTASAARVYESYAGLSWQRGGQMQASITSTYSLHRQWDQMVGSESSQSRIRLDGEGETQLGLSQRSKAKLTLGARWWGNTDDLRTGDEWFLGGETLRGYADRSVLAAEGVWSRIEFSQTSHLGLGATVFGEVALLSMFDNSYTRPASIGLAFLLESPGRSGRLELAWKDHATMSDGILRLSVIQGW